MRRALLLWIAAQTIICIFGSTSARAGWTLNGAPVCTAGGDQSVPQMCPDGDGGAIITWMDGRSITDIYAQRVDEMGRPLWTTNGVVVCNAANGQGHPRIVSDGAGGAIIVWADQRVTDEYDVYVQRIDSDGVSLWTANGVAVCTVAGYQVYPQICTDGAGGCFIAWEDRRASGNSDIYAQRVDSHGAPLWTADGIAVCTADSLQWDVQLVADGAGGAVLVWSDYRTNGDLFAQRLDGSGAALWAAGGIAVCANSETQYFHEICTDGAGGVFVTWYERRPTTFDIYVQRINAAGAEVFATCGVALCTLAETQRNPQIAADGAGGAIVAWEDFRGGSGDSDLYVQRIGPTGSILWPTAQGEPVCALPSSVYAVTLVGDGSGGAIVAWADNRNAALTDLDVYAAHIDRHGDAVWTGGDRVVCEVAGSEWDLAIMSDGAGGAIIAWRDSRNMENDIRAQRILNDGSFTAVTLESFSATCDGDAVRVAWRVAAEDPALRCHAYRRDGSSRKLDELPASMIERGGREYSLIDRSFPPGSVVAYRVEAADGEERRLLFETEPIATPAPALQLFQNHPNPFNPSTTIRFRLPIRSRVMLGVYDVGGRLVARLVDGMRDAGMQETSWNGLDSEGVPVAAGIYFSRLSAGKEAVTRTMVLLR